MPPFQKKVPAEPDAASVLTRMSWALFATTASMCGSAIIVKITLSYLFGA